MGWQDTPRPKRFRHLATDPRGFPVISTIERGSDGAAFGSVSGRRKLALAAFDWCAVCAYPFGDELRWQALPIADGSEKTRQEEWYGEAPVHEVCLLYAAHVCPHLASPGARLGDEFRAGRRRTPLVRAIGYRTTRRIDIGESNLQAGLFRVRFAHANPVDHFTYERPADVADRFASVLAAEDLPRATEAEEWLIRAFDEVSAAGTAVVAAAMAVGAVFARNALRLPGLEPFATPRHQAVAAGALMPAGLEQLLTAGDPAVRAAARWLRDRGDDGPPLLRAWRKEARARLAPAPPAATGPGRTTPKNAPCPCGSGRRAARCHPAGVG